MPREIRAFFFFLCPVSAAVVCSESEPTDITFISGASGMPMTGEFCKPIHGMSDIGNIIVRRSDDLAFGGVSHYQGCTTPGST